MTTTMTTGEGGTPSDHWESVYSRRRSNEVSWFRPHFDLSVTLLAAAGLSPASRVIDVGGGASTLVDDLLVEGVADITVLDLSPAALDVARERLGDRGTGVRWLVGDIRDIALPAAGFDLWHDRAVLHFLVSDADAAAYARQAAAAIRPGGFAVIGGFAPDGPERCSGLTVARRSADDIAALLGDAFELVDRRREDHTTPGGAVQRFEWALARRRLDRSDGPGR